MRTELFYVQVSPSLSSFDIISLSLATANKCSGLNCNMKTIKVYQHFHLGKICCCEDRTIFCTSLSQPQ